FRLARHVRERKSADRVGSIDRNQEKRLGEPYRLAQVLQLNPTIKEWAEHRAVEKRPIGVGPAADLDLAHTGRSAATASRIQNLDLRSGYPRYSERIGCTSTVP